MTELCEVCPRRRPGRNGTLRSLVSELRTTSGRFAVVLGAGRDASESSHQAALEWQDAIVAITVAVVQRGGTVVVPADAELVTMVCLAALPLSATHGAEALLGSSSVRSIETGGADPVARSLLGPFAHRGVLAYCDRHHNPVAPGELPRMPPPDGAGSGDRFSARHPLSADLLEGTQAIGALVIHPTGPLREEMQLLASVSPNVVAIGNDNNGWMAALASPLERQFERDATMPLGVLAELLVEQWLQRDR